MRRLLFLLLLLAGCDEAPTPAEPAPDAMASSPARWVAPRPAEGRVILEAPARVLAAPEATGEVNVLYQARINSVEVQPGDQVDEGEPIAVVTMPEVNEAAAALVASRHQLRIAKEKQDNLRALEREGLTRRSALFEVQTQIAELIAAREQARAKLAAYQVENPAQLLETGRLTLRSPTFGVVTQVEMTPGEIVEPGGPPLARIRRDGAARVEARLPSALPSGMELTFVSLTGEAISLESEPLAVAVDGSTGGRLAWFAPVEPVVLPDGLAGTLRGTPVEEGLFEIPATAVTPEGFVMVRGPEGPERRRVTVLVSDGATAVVRGLSSEDRLLAEAGNER